MKSFWLLGVILVILAIGFLLVKSKLDSCDSNYTKMFQELEQKSMPSGVRVNTPPVPPRPSWSQCLLPQ